MVAHDLIFFIRQRQRWRDGDRIARMHAHRIHIFNRTDDNGVIRGVAHHFHFIFFPTQKRFIHQNLVHRRSIHARAAIIFKIIAVIGHAAACSAQRKGWANDRGQSDFIQGLIGHANASVQIGFTFGIFRRGNNRGFGVFDPQPIHRFAK